MGTGAVRFPRHLVFVAAGVVTLLATASGCQVPASTGGNAPASPANANDGTPYKIVAEATGFYKLGPQQPSGPDLSLKRDTRLALLKRGFGYSKVRLEDGQVGLVGNEDMRALTPQEIAAFTLPPTNTTLPPGRSPLFGATNPPRRPRFRAPTLPIPPDAQEPSLPAPDTSPTPQPGPTPKFRY